MMQLNPSDDILLASVAKLIKNPDRVAHRSTAKGEIGL